jgi:3-oxoacyl-[acyl-carrier protein] reductase
MDLELNGKVALVLGAGGGLGSAIARELSAEGCRVAAVDINEDALAETVSRIAASASDKCAIRWDMNDTAAAGDIVTQVRDALGEIDIVVNITGGPPPTPTRDQDADSWSRYFDSMVLSVIKLADAALPGMIERGWGRILTSTSSGVVAPIPNLGLSNSLRSTLVGWSKSLAAEIARYGVTSNIIVPGRIYTGRIKALDEARAAREGSTVEDVVAASTASIPVGRYGQPSEYAKVAAFLVSGPASYVTGSVVRVDGGFIPSI